MYEKQKKCNVYGGCIVQVTTQQRNPDGSYAIAEAVCFVPDNQIISEEDDPTKFEPFIWEIP
jgi:hypothetical protein